ncbi:low molecular weight phosphotyrosine protein phosphatase-like [Ptychodera flava]|uniref:low molecular weight phosphotyrosine protein phosphatase-like n=1 Tax=Ptychodera flava TaxID=63121 RepID=UPI00396A31D0
MATPGSKESMGDSKRKHSVLFVCFGNYCRSPVAEGAFSKLLKDKGLSDQWNVDSAGLSDWHVGKLPDNRGRTVMKTHNIKTEHIGRQITEEDYLNFEYIFGMDESNLWMLESDRPPGSKAVIQLLGSHDPQGGDVIEDCYYGDVSSFEEVYQKSMRSCKAFLQHVMDKDET